MTDAAHPTDDLRPEVALPSSGPPAFLMVAIAVILGIGLFLFLDARRRAAEEGQASPRVANLPAPPQPLAIPPALPPVPVIVIEEPEVADRPPAPPPPAPPPIRLQPTLAGEAPYPQPRAGPDPDAARASAGNAMVVDLTAGSGAAISGAGPAPAGEAGAATAVTGDDSVRATLIRNRASIIPQGAIIAAVLETPLNSDRPGLARAIVSEDARGFDGTRVLIPRGSRLIGEFRSDGSPNLKRVLVTWTRLIRPDGVAMKIGSPSADPLGGAGIAGRVNSHFFERFTSAVLQSALTIGVNLASQTRNDNSIYIGLPAQASQIGQQLIPNMTKPPTVKVRAGVEVTVLVARDLDFGGTPAVR